MNLKTIFILTFLTLPQSLLACAVCGFGEDGSRMVYMATTILMTLVPLAMLAGVGIFVRKKIKQLNDADASSTNTQE
ncbi:MAG: hypothetical protein HOO06_05495 [Bdellovibrionaceae bacterium]|jgi:hypothetical protein|nr:hypothetical protein [Pseudobdellovibrionaceae bacterium]